MYGYKQPRFIYYTIIVQSDKFICVLCKKGYAYISISLKREVQYWGLFLTPRVGDGGSLTFYIENNTGNPCLKTMHRNDLYALVWLVDPVVLFFLSTEKHRKFHKWISLVCSYLPFCVTDWNGGDKIRVMYVYLIILTITPVPKLDGLYTVYIPEINAQPCFSDALPYSRVGAYLNFLTEIPVDCKRCSVTCMRSTADRLCYTFSNQLIYSKQKQKKQCPLRRLYHNFC